MYYIQQKKRQTVLEIIIVLNINKLGQNKSERDSSAINLKTYS